MSYKANRLRKLLEDARRIFKPRFKGLIVYTIKDGIAQSMDGKTIYGPVDKWIEEMEKTPQAQAAAELGVPWALKIVYATGELKKVYVQPGSNGR